jgi:UDP-2,3-diacylglucosamine pyrophosphatase LpxH
MKRSIDLVVLSDLHLGTFGCHANELLAYLREIDPKILILNGDIIDIWQFKKKFFPPAHIQVIREILKMSQNGTRVHYITGNHDEALRRYSGTQLGQISIEDKLVLDVDGKAIWFFHGDVFDATTKGWAKVIAQLGGQGYDLLIWINHQVNRLLDFFGQERMSLSKKVKYGVKKAVAWIGDFEETAAELAIQKRYQAVVCGHIHQPQMRKYTNEQGSVMYMNSGDWLENCTALEYSHGEWKLYQSPLGKRQKIQQEHLEPVSIPDVFASEILYAFQSL